MLNQYDIIILGGGAAGLMSAISAGQRGRCVLLLEHANRIGKKILMSGGGRCNFTNLNTTASNFLSNNPHFCKSALARYTPWDFVGMVGAHEIPWHEKGPGQLFCDRSSKDIVAMLADECSKVGVKIRTSCNITSVTKDDAADGDFSIDTSLGIFTAPSLIVATGELSIPRMGATGFGHQLAQQFGLEVLPLRAGLVPFTLPPKTLAHWSVLSGASIDVHVSTADAAFREPMLFTHRGLSGPSILQLSSYWQPGMAVQTDLMPDEDAANWLNTQREQHPKQSLRNALMQPLSKRIAEVFFERALASRIQPETTLAELTREQMDHIAAQLNGLSWYPDDTEGYRTAEVTLGGINTDQLSSKTMQANNVPGLYFVGEVVDVTGQLGGYNFQWAWASGWCAGQAA